MNCHARGVLGKPSGRLFCVKIFRAVTGTTRFLSNDIEDMREQKMTGCRKFFSLV